MSDPFCQVIVGPTSNIKRSTEVKEGTVNAIWEAKYSLEHIALTDAEFEREKVSLRIFDKNDIYTNKLIGSYEFGISNVYRQKGHQYYRRWVPIALPDDPEVDQGYLMVTIWVLAPGDAIPAIEQVHDEDKETVLKEPELPSRNFYVLNVLVYRGVDILALYDEVPTTFVTVRFNGNVTHTHPAPKNNSPVWNKRLELPFSIPLRSDAIEVQLWNRLRGRPDKLIGQQTFNYYQLGLTHKSWGPKWVNLYSNDVTPTEVTMLGALTTKLFDGVASEESEYVGKTLVRMSVSLRDYKNPAKLASVPCTPVSDPIAIDYALNFMLYCGSEIPVMGGMVMVELCFGKYKQKSSWQNGKNGIFQWNETFPPIYANAPLDKEQLNEPIINVYHKVGSKITKIGYERISIASLLPGAGFQATHGSLFTQLDERSRKPPVTALDLKEAKIRESKSEMKRLLDPSTRDGNEPGAISFTEQLDSHSRIEGEYYVNGDQWTSRMRANWPTKWRSLKHVTKPTEENKHVVAGFLLCSIGFGLQQCMPDYIPKPIAQKPHLHALRCYIHHASNLPAADDAGVSSPSIVIRFGGANSTALETKNDTLFPYWYRREEIRAPIDPQHPPSIYMMVYHQTAMSYTLIGRCEILAEHVMKNPRKLLRYRLEKEEQFGKEKKAKDPEATPADDNSPYVLASFELAHWTKEETDKGWHSTKQHAKYLDMSTSREKEGKKPELIWRPICQDYMFQFEAVGLRDLQLADCDHSGPFEIDLAIPRILNHETSDADVTEWKKQVDKGDTRAEWHELPPLRGEKRQGDSVQFTRAATFPRVSLPLSNQWGVPLRIRVYAVSGGSRDLLGTSFVPLASFLSKDDLARAKVQQLKLKALKEGKQPQAPVSLSSQPPPPSTVPPAGTEEPEPLAGELWEIQATQPLRARLPLAPPEFYIYDERDHNLLRDADDDEDDRRDKEAAESGDVVYKAGDIDDDGNVVFEDPTQSADERKALLASKRPPKDVYVDLRPESLNASVLRTEQNYWRTDKGDDNEDYITAKQYADEAEARALAIEEGKEVKGERPSDILTIDCYRGKEVGFGSFAQSLFNYKTSSLHQKSCSIKAFARLAPLPTYDSHAATRQSKDRLVGEYLQANSQLKTVGDMYGKKWTSRLYVYEANNLEPAAKGILGRYETASPFLVIRNVSRSEDKEEQVLNTREEAVVNELNPNFFKCFDIPTSLPANNMLEIAIWDRAEGIGQDRLIGVATMDVEKRLLERKPEGKREPLLLRTPKSSVFAGKLFVKLDILPEEQALRQKPEEIHAPEAADYELRLVIWNTRDIRFPEEKDRDNDVDQRILVHANFDGEYGEDVSKSTDVAWFSASGSAEWNYRMKWRLKVPCKVPRLKFVMWDENVLTENEGIGELIYNLQPFFTKCMRDKQPISKHDMAWHPFSHPNYAGVKLGEVNVQFWLYTAEEADKNPVGEAQNEPNKDPWLADPKRNLPPWAVGSRGLDWLGKRKAMIICLLAIVVLVPILFPLLVTFLQSSVL